MLGYGLSEKPDQAYTMALQADIAEAFTAALGLDRLGLLSHDVGDTVGGELLARQLDGTWPVEITDRVLANGSIYVALAELSVGQQFLLGLPDRRLESGGPVDRDTVAAGVAATFSPTSSVDPEELAAQVELIAEEDGHLLLPRLIRYIEERRRSESRFTGAIERHPSPLTVVWGIDDPIAVPAMVDRLRRARPDATVVLLDGVGHYPMVEAPDRFVSPPWPVPRRLTGSRIGGDVMPARTSPWRAANQPSAEAAHRCQPSANAARSVGVAIPWASNCSAMAELVNRSAHSPPHQARSSGVAKHQVEAVATTVVNPAAWAQRQQAPSGVPVGPVHPGQGAVGGDGPGHLGILGKVPEAGVVAVPCRHQPTGPAHPAHLHQGGHRVADVLEHLVGVDHVEGPVVEAEVEDAPLLEGH